MSIIVSIARLRAFAKSLRRQDLLAQEIMARRQAAACRAELERMDRDEVAGALRESSADIARRIERAAKRGFLHG